MLAPWKKSFDKPRQYINKQRHYFADKDPYSQSHGFFSSHVWMWELDYEEDWAMKNWGFQTMVLEKSLESPLDSKEIRSVNPKGSQPWILFGRTSVEAKAPILWPPDAKSRLIGKDPDPGKDCEQEETETTGWDGWMASLTQWTCVWANSRRWWRTGKPGMLQFHGVARSRIQFSEWTTVTTSVFYVCHLFHFLLRNSVENKPPPKGSSFVATSLPWFLVGLDFFLLLIVYLFLEVINFPLEYKVYCHKCV